MVFVYVMLAVAGILCLWGAISPMGMWRTTAAWRFANPEAQRPSGTQNTVTRVTCVIMLVCVIVAFPLLARISSDVEDQKQEEAYEDCLEENDDDEGLLSPEDWCENLSPEPEES